jgi:hypothetical protein
MTPSSDSRGSCARRSTGLTYNAWRDEELSQIAVAWIGVCGGIRIVGGDELDADALQIRGYGVFTP